MIFRLHETQLGDTWESLSARYGVPVEVLQAFNLITFLELPSEVRIPEVPAGSQWWIDETQPTPIPILITPENSALLAQRQGSTFTQQAPIELSIPLPSNVTTVIDNVDVLNATQALEEWMLQAADLSAYTFGYELRQLYGDVDIADLTLSQLQQGYENSLLTDLYFQLIYTQAFGDTDLSPEEFLQIMEGVSLEELAALSNEYASIASQMFSAEPNQYQAEYELWRRLYEAGYTQIDQSGLSLAGSIERLSELSIGYLSNVQIDAMRAEAWNWRAVRQRSHSLLTALRYEIDRMPVDVLGLSAETVKHAFEAFYIAEYQNYSDLEALLEFVEEYERGYAERQAAREEQGRLDDASLPPLIETILGFNDIADVILVLRDWLVTGRMDSLALLSIAPFIPGSLMRRLRSIFESIPGFVRLAPRFSWSILSGVEVASLGSNRPQAIFRAFRTSLLARQLGVDIHIAGRLADTVAEAELRRRATLRALEELMVRRPEFSASIQNVLENPNLYSRTIERLTRQFDTEVLWHNLQLQASNFYARSIGPFQVSISSGKSEVDVYIPHAQWANYSPEQQRAIEEDIEKQIKQIYGVDVVDIYNTLEGSGISASWRIEWPTSNPPPGTIRFQSNGSIIHEPFA